MFAVVESAGTVEVAGGEEDGVTPLTPVAPRGETPPLALASRSSFIVGTVALKCRRYISVRWGAGKGGTGKPVPATGKEGVGGRGGGARVLCMAAICPSSLYC